MDTNDRSVTSCHSRTEPLHILAHRGNLSGPLSCSENSLDALREAVARNFGVEFDVRTEPEKNRLTLAHDPSPWSPQRDALSFLKTRATFDSPLKRHALNIKSLSDLPEVTDALLAAGTQSQFFLFDFELLSDRLVDCLSRMHDLADRGFAIAYRISEREPFFRDYLNAFHIRWLWLDEWSEPWVTRDHLAALNEAGKRSYYVSPELHGCCDEAYIARRWDDIIAWGVSGICTDYPLQLQRRLRGDRND